MALQTWQTYQVSSHEEPTTTKQVCIRATGFISWAHGHTIMGTYKIRNEQVIEIVHAYTVSPSPVYPNPT